ncbi:MAG: GspE/PulE family protein [Armatimonadota bacterium]|nr:GspE/PulE family protein [bacterium]
MNCDQVRTEIIAYLKDELTADKKNRLEEHLARCPLCRHELEGARRLLSWTEAASEDVVVKKVEEIIDGAIKASASDIHLESQRDNTLLVRYRIDGVMHQITSIESVQRQGIITRLKMMSDMSVEENRVPQDGRLPWKLDGKDYDIRVYCMPYVYGEGIVMRILDRSNVCVDLNKIGLSEEHLAMLERIIHQPMGLFFTSGPTGSGKTTTLYSILMRLVSPAIKVMTIEDPVEYLLPGINQAHVNKSAGFTFPNALRSFMRHDPDVIAVGEIRDLETAQLAVEAAITGHMVFSQLHTDDAVGVIQRLRDMGVDNFLIGAAFVGIESQRMVRKVCPDCTQPVDVDLNDPILRFFGITQNDLIEHKIYRGEGCPNCRGTGYRGQIGIYEIIEIDRDMRDIIGSGATSTEILNMALAKGFKTLRDNAKEKILAGITTPEEAFRVLV